MVLKISSSIILFLGLCSQMTAQSPKQQAAEAYRLYADSALESSAELYEKSLSLSPNADYLFNLGNTYQKLGDAEKARKAYEGALNSSSSSEELKSKAAYNLGNMEYAEDEYEKAIDYFKRALINNPEDVQASENLQIAQAQLQMQQQQQQQEQQQQDQQQQPQDQSDEDNQQQQPQDTLNEEDEGSEGNQDSENPSEEEEPQDQPSQSTKLSKEQAEDFFERLNEVENQTKSRLNEDLLKEKSEAKNKKITKDW